MTYTHPVFETGLQGFHAGFDGRPMLFGVVDLVREDIKEPVRADFAFVHFTLPGYCTDLRH